MTKLCYFKHVVTAAVTLSETVNHLNFGPIITEALLMMSHSVTTYWIPCSVANMVRSRGEQSDTRTPVRNIMTHTTSTSSTVVLAARW